MKLVQARPWGS